VDKNRLWQNVLGEVEVSLTKASFNTWFKGTEIIELSDTKVVISVPNVFTKEWLSKKYEKDIKNCLAKSIPSLTEVEYRIGTLATKSEFVFKSTKSAADNDTNLTEKPVATTTTKTTGVTSSHLNPRYTFPNFVIGESNKLAHAAAEAVTKSPGITYNPLFIYGGVGLGKTHLLQAVGNGILAGNNKKKVVYVTSEKFTNEFINSIHKRTTKEFKEKYRKVDCLLIDDIQFLAGKEGTQEEFFHTFNTLYENNKQIVLTSDRPPKAIPTLEARLRSRFEWGMSADISPPNYETRFAILRSKAANIKLQLPEELLKIIAQRVQNNVRELEGALTRVLAFSQLNETIPTIEEVEGLLGGMLVSPGKRFLKIGEVIKTISKHYGVKKEDVLGPKRNKEIVFPRQIIVFILRNEMDLPYKSIGRELGGRDHTTIIHDYNKIKKLVIEDSDLEQEIEEIKNKLYSVD